MIQPRAHQSLSEYLTVGEAAEFLGVSPWTLRNWDKTGKLKPRRHPKNGYRIYRHEDLAAILAPQQGGLNDGEWDESEHFVQFYENDDYLTDSVSGYIGATLGAGGGAVVVATPSHRQEIHKKLNDRGVGRLAEGQYIEMDAQETLAKFMVAGQPDPARFNDVIGEVLTQAAKGRTRVCAFGEMVALLCADGNRDAAIRLEELWNELAKTHLFSLFCAYPIRAFSDSHDAAPLNDICKCHSRVVPTESYAVLSNSGAQLRAIALLQQKAQSLEAEIAHRKEAEKALVQRERELSDFFENASEGLHQVGPDGRIRWANKAELELLGVRANQYIGHHISEFHADPEVIDGMLAKLLRGESLYNQPARLRCQDGSLKHVLINSNAYFEDGELVYTRCFTRDVTQWRQTEEALRDSEQRFAHFMQCLPGLAWIKDLEGRYLYANETAQKAFRASDAELYGRTDVEIFDAATADQFIHNDHLALGSAAGIQAIETLQHADGSLHHSIVSKFAIPGADGQPALIGGMAVDITERIRAEEALKEADRRKDEFLATLAHELRNPLAPISNALETMRLGERDDALDEARTIMERQVRQMVRIVDDLLDVSRITRGKLDLRTRRLELSEVLKSAVETSRPWIEAARHELIVELPAQPVYLDGDLTRLAQVFSNLLNNSAKYTEAVGRIELAAMPQGSNVLVSVRDNGIGIPPEELPHIFRMFRQVDGALERSRGGLGIGLTLVQTLVELHGGKIEAHSAGPGRGSEFTVRLPLAPQEANDAKLAPFDGTAAKPFKRRILVVDDNADSATTLSMMLRLKGNEVRTANDGRQAIECAAEFLPDMIFMDVGMPNLNGYDATRQIREKPWGKEIIVVALTGWGQPEDIKRSHEAGCTAHMVKPIDFSALEKLLASMSK